MQSNSRIVAIVAIIAAAALAACGGSKDSYAESCRQAPLCVPPSPGPIDPSGAHLQYVVDSIRFAEGVDEVPEFSLDLDCSESERADNQMGRVLRAVYDALDTDLNAIVAETIADGRVIHLIDVQTSSVTDAFDVGVRVFVGIDSDGDPSDNFTGDEMFAVDDVASTAMAGVISGGQVSATYGDVPLQVALPGVEDVSLLELSAARADGAITADRLELTIAGIMPSVVVESGFLTVAHAAIESVVESECADGVCPPNSRGGLLVDAFDVDGDGAVAFEEVRGSELVGALLAPDVDMFDTSGRLNPGCDGETDALSLGVTITAVPAQFALPLDGR